MDANEHQRQATAEAAEWWVLLLSDDLPPEKRAQFVDWLRESALHVAEMLRIAQVHGALEQFHRWPQVAAADARAGESRPGRGPVVANFPLTPRPPSPPVASRRGWALRRIGFGLGVATLVAAVLVVWTGLLSSSVIQTGRGERRTLSLADGSAVTVDPETKLRIRFGPRFRRIYLERGRARFRVAKDQRRPFLVRADGTLVRAVGTDFGVERRARGIVVTVAEGTVAVLPRPRDGPLSPPAIMQNFLDSNAAHAVAGRRGTSARGATAPVTTAAHDPVVMLTAGQQLTVHESGSADAIREVDTKRALAWADGRLVFDNQSIAAVVAEFNRYNNLQLHVADDVLAKRTVSGVFDASDPESFIAFVQTMTPVHVSRSGQDITITPAH